MQKVRLIQKARQKKQQKRGKGTKQKTEDFLFQKNWVLFGVACGWELCFFNSNIF